MIALKVNINTSAINWNCSAVKLGDKERIKVRQIWNDFFKPTFLPKNEGTNSFLLLVNLFLFVSWKKVKTPKRHFEINWPFLDGEQPGNSEPCLVTNSPVYIINNLALVNNFSMTKGSVSPIWLYELHTKEDNKEMDCNKDCLN